MQVIDPVEHWRSVSGEKVNAGRRAAAGRIHREPPGPTMTYPAHAAFLAIAGYASAAASSTAAFGTACRATQVSQRSAAKRNSPDIGCGPSVR
jgi:hypothetical protein